ncbi:MAG TPA: class I SAM-dependent methyltransferase [Nitrososphaerales archaeon]|nr:class I SAM-dependent methyltransferase [Nitrososphaerales archaeon]
MSDSEPPLARKALKIFSGLSDSYDSVLDYGTLMQDRRWKDWVIKNSLPSGGSQILDVGCGTCVLESRLSRECSVVGVDLTEEMIRIGQSKRLESVSSLLLSDGERLPFREASFDIVVSCYVVKYCDTPSFISEMARVLRPGGRLVLYDFARPRGSFWPFNAIYTYGGLRIIGRMLEMKRSRSAYTFSALPEIISSRPWDVKFGSLLEKFGFVNIVSQLLSGGTAVGFTAIKP